MVERGTVSALGSIGYEGFGEDERTARFAEPARVGEGGAAGIVLLHDAHGIDGHVESVAHRLSGEGHAVVVPDLWERGGPPGAERPGPASSEEEVRAAVEELADEAALGDIEGATAALAERDEVDASRIAVVGIGMGGTYAFLHACRSTRVRAAVDFYGPAVYPRLSPRKPMQPLEMALNLGCPLLAFFGERDESIPRADVERMRRVLSQSAKHFDIVTYPGVGHAFLDETRASHDADAALDAWRRTTAFLRECFSEEAW